MRNPSLKTRMAQGLRFTALVVTVLFAVDHLSFFGANPASFNWQNLSTYVPFLIYAPLLMLLFNLWDRWRLTRRGDSAAKAN